MRKLLSIAVLLLFITACEKDDIDQQLPAVTQTGARTFGCLINGEVFAYSGDEITSFYTLGEKHFNVSVQNFNRNPRVIRLGTFYQEILEGETYQLTESTSYNAFAKCNFTTPNNIEGFVSTNATYTGELTITKLDFENNIVSGTFWFDLQHPVTGERVEIREGRFDTVFTAQ